MKTDSLANPSIAAHSIMMRMLSLLLVVCGFVLGSARAQESEVLVMSLHGSCRTDNGRYVDLDRAMFLENRTIDVGEGAQRRRIRVEAETFYIEDLWSRTPSTRYLEVEEEIGDGVLRDIELKLVSVEGELALYWRETYQHQQYRQGVMRIGAEGLIRWCNGFGGTTRDR